MTDRPEHEPSVGGVPTAPDDAVAQPGVQVSEEPTDLAAPPERPPFSSVLREVMSSQGIVVAAAIVELDDILERREPPVVHIRPAQFDVTQRRRAESAVVGRISADRAAAEIVSVES